MDTSFNPDVNVSVARQALDYAESLTGQIESSTRLPSLCREAWMHYGQALLAQRTAMSSNKSFGAWVRDNHLGTGLAKSSVVRSDAMWMAANFAVLNQFKTESYGPTHIRQECRDAGLAWAFKQQRVKPMKIVSPEISWTTLIADAVFEGTLPSNFSANALTKKTRWPRREIDAAFGRPIPRKLDPASADAHELIDVARRVYALRKPALVIEAAAIAIATSKENVSPGDIPQFEKLLSKAIAAYVIKLEAEFAQRVEAATAAARKRLEEKYAEADAELRAAQEEHDMALQMRLGLDSHMSMEEFRLVLSCLHPDKHPPDAQERYSRAFAIFKRLERTVNTKLPITVLRQRGWETVSPFFKSARV